jgi:thiol-disulfide isomerase/thioredoxin
VTNEADTPVGQTDPPGRTGLTSTPVVIGIVAALIAVAAVVAIVLSRGSDDGSTASSPPPVERQLVPADLDGEIGDIAVDGEPLPKLAAEGTDPAIGLTPPTITAVNPDGEVHTISPDTDGPVMLVFLAHWCPHCNDEIPRLEQLQREGRLPADLEVYGVLTGMSPDRPNYPPSSWIVDREWPWPAIADAATFGGDSLGWQMADAFGLRGYPYAVVIDDGVVAARWAGGSEIDDLEAKIAAAVS